MIETDQIKKEEISLKRKLTALLLTLCMLLTIFPAALPARAAQTNTFRVNYDMNWGIVFWSKGEQMPTDDVENFLADGGNTGIVTKGKQVNFLLDPTHAPDRDLWEQNQDLEIRDVETDADTAVYVRVNYETEDGWYDGLAVSQNVAQDGYSFENNVLSFTPQAAIGEVHLDVYWSNSDYVFYNYGWDTEAIIIEFNSWGPGTVLWDETLEVGQLVQDDHFRGKILLPLNTQSLIFTWTGHLRTLGVGGLGEGDEYWGEFNEPAFTSYTLMLDQTDDQGNPSRYYNINFDFAWEWNYLYSIDYDMNGGLVFQTVDGGTPLANADCFLPRRDDQREDWPGEISFETENGPGTIRLLFDETKAMDWDAWNQNEPELCFTEPWSAEDRAITVVVSYNDGSSNWVEDVLVEKGVPANGVSFANNVLSYTPPNGYQVEFRVYWTESDYDYLCFGPEEGEILVDYGWNDGHQPTLVQEEAVIRDLLQEDRCRRRVVVADSTESLSFTWEGWLEHVWGNNVLHDGEWGDVFNYAQDTFTLYLDENNRNYYDLNFNFDNDWNYLYAVNYDMNGGLVFQTVDGGTPQATAADFLPRQGEGRDGWPDNISFETENGPGTIQLRFDESKAIDWDAWDQEEPELDFVDPWYSDDRAITVVAKYNDAQHNWHEDVLVEYGVPADGVSFVDNILSFTPPCGFGVDFDLFWTREDYEFSLFRPTEEKPVMVEINWRGSGDLEVVNALPEEDILHRDGRMRVRLSWDVSSLTLDWGRAPIRRFRVEGLEEDWIYPDNGVECYSLELDQLWDDGNPRDWYRLEFEFEENSFDESGMVWVDYDWNKGSVFSTLGYENWPEDVPEEYRFSGYENRFCFLDEGGDQLCINLLLDPDQAINWDRWENDGEIEFRDSMELNMRNLIVHVRSNELDGYPIWGGNLTEFGEYNGFFMTYGVTTDNGILHFTPISDSDIEIQVYWCWEDWEFDDFQGTEDAPVVVQLDWWGDGEVQVQEAIPEYDRIDQDGRTRVRIPYETESLTFTWDESKTLRQINVEGLSEDGGWLNGIQPEGSSYTLSLDQFWDNGDPRNWYHIQFEFEDEGGGGGNLAAFYEQGYGSVFWALGEDSPVADAEHYLGFGFENSFCFRPDGQRQPIHLLFDGSLGLDYDAFFNGEIQFVDSPVPPEDRIVGVYADSGSYSGPVFWGGEVVGPGLEHGYSYANGVLTILPENDDDIILHVYWTQADADFDGFQGTEDYPVIVEYSWFNYGEIPIPDGIPEGNYFVHETENRVRLRLPLDAESVTFTWAEEYGVRQIDYSCRSTEGDWWESVYVDQSQPHSYTLYLDQTEYDQNQLVPVTWYQISFDFFEDSRYQLWVNWTGSEGNVYFNLNEAPPAVTDSDSYDLERYYVNYSDQAPSFRVEDQAGNVSIGTVYLRLDPAHSVGYFGEVPSMWDLPAWEGYSPSVYVEYPLLNEQDEWFEGFVVENGQAVAQGFSFADNVLSFTPLNEKPVIIHIFWSQADRDYWDFDSTEENPVVVELMLGGRAPVELPSDVQAENIHVWHAAEHDYVKLRVPAERESMEFRWAREGLIGYIEVDGAGPDGSVLELDPPVGTSYTLNLDQSEFGQPKEHYFLSFWQFYYPETPFVDVPENAWYHEAVLFAWSSGLTAGTSENTFSPNRTVTRAEVVTFLWAAENPEPTRTECPFHDVPEDAWYREAVCWAVENEITAGTSGGSFSPNSCCTRAEVVTFLWRAAGSPEPEGNDCPFEDVSETAWYRNAVLWAVEKGVTAGTADNLFSPGLSCTRAQIAMFLYRYLMYVD